MKKCAVFNDLSGFGKCSLAANLPILSAFQLEAHPFPTAVLSNQTAYESFALADVSRKTADFLAEWEKLGARFDGILTGYFINAQQVNLICEFIKKQGALTVVDPVMGDGGERYSGFDDELCKSIKRLCLLADVITPNSTELFILTGEEDVEAAAEQLINSGIGAVVVTGIESEGKIGCRVFTKDDERCMLADKHGDYYSGTGDIFTSVLTAELLNGLDVFSAADKAVKFVSDACGVTPAGNPENGVDFERIITKYI